MRPDSELVTQVLGSSCMLTSVNDISWNLWQQRLNCTQNSKSGNICKSVTSLYQQWHKIKTLSSLKTARKKYRNPQNATYKKAPTICPPPSLAADDGCALASLISTNPGVSKPQPNPTDFIILATPEQREEMIKKWLKNDERRPPDNRDWTKSSRTEQPKN
jgi:hypothetical protein